MYYFKFVTWEPAPIEQVLTGRIPAALQEYDRGNKKPLKALQLASASRFYKLGGWCFDLGPYLRRFWVQTRYCGIVEYYAVNKTAIRNELKSACIKIVEVPA